MSEKTRFERLKDAFHELSELPQGAREEALERFAQGDSAFGEELRSLLAAAEEETERFDVPITRLAGASEVEPNEQIPGYRILKPIGRGGSAVVYLAEQQGDGFTRRVALKVLEAWIDPERASRLRDEQRILATLEHPGIARLYDAGVTPSGRAFLAMEWVEGETLLDACRTRGLSTRERLRLFRSVLDAVDYAHGEQVVHRDLKPANILVSARGEAKLLDFGIARLREQGTEGSDATVTRHRAMTPAYASPEQVSGGSVDVRSDVYSLGVVLYELLTDRRPYRIKDSSFDTLERAIREQEPERPSTAVTRDEPAPSSKSEPSPAAPETPEAPPAFVASDVGRRERLRRELRGDLDAIVLKALRKEPQARYASVTELAEDLDRYLDGRPVLARRGTAVYLLSKAARRHRLLLANLGLVAALAVGGWFWLERREAGSRAQQVAPDGSIWLATSVGERAEADYRAGIAATARADFSTAREKLEAAVRAEPKNALLHAALAHAKFLGDQKPSSRGEAQFALTLADHLPQEIRLLIEAIAQRGLAENETAAELLGSLWLLRPRDLEVGLLLGETLSWNGQLSEALELFETLRATTEPKSEGALRVGLSEINALGHGGRPKDVVEKTPPLIALARAQGRPEMEAQLLVGQSYAESALGRLPEARASAERSQRLFREHHELRGAARAENLFCVAAIQEAEYQEADQRCNRALVEHRRLGDLSTAARVLSNLSVTYRRRGLLPKARDGYLEALALEKSAFGNPIASARILHNLANVEVEMGDLRAAQEHLGDAILVLRASENQLSLSHSLAALSVVEKYLGSLPEATALLAEATTIAEKAAPPTDLAMVHVMNGDLHRSLGDDTQAKRLYGQARVLLEASPQRDHLVNLDLATSFLEVSTPALCQKLERGQAELEQLLDNTAVQVAIVVSRCWTEVGNVEAATRWIARAAPAAAATKHVEDLRDLALARAELALAQSRLSEAETAIREADVICRRHGYAEQRLEVRLLETRLALARGDHPERVRVLAEELVRDAQSASFGRIAKKAESFLRALPRR